MYIETSELCFPLYAAKQMSLQKIRWQDLCDLADKLDW